MADKSKSLALSFPNLSRSFDATKQRVRFWGYDRAIEISFFVDTAAFKKFGLEAGGTEADALEAFDTMRDRIHDVATKIYTRGRKGTYSYSLVAEDF